MAEEINNLDLQNTNIKDLKISEVLVYLTEAQNQNAALCSKLKKNTAYVLYSLYPGLQKVDDSLLMDIDFGTNEGTLVIFAGKQRMSIEAFREEYKSKGLHFSEGYY